MRASGMAPARRAPITGTHPVRAGLVLAFVALLAPLALFISAAPAAAVSDAGVPAVAGLQSDGDVVPDGGQDPTAPGIEPEADPGSVPGSDGTEDSEPGAGSSDGAGQLAGSNGEVLAWIALGCSVLIAVAVALWAVRHGESDGDA